jgi:NAD(P)-dependent dehydrogenase (short-subunit alcohol dehydrogenase family)
LRPHRHLTGHCFFFFRPQFCRQLVLKGNKVIATARRPADAKELNQLADANKGKVVVTELDVTDATSVQRWAAGLPSVAPSVDVLINNAGVIVRDGFDDITAEEMVYCFQTNTVGPLLVTQHVFKAGLLRKGSSMVANITSKMGSIDDNGSGGYYAYRASKAALNIGE